MVDDEDYDYLNQWKWHAAKVKHLYYAVRNSLYRDNPKRTQIQMHVVINKTPKGLLTDHIDGNGLNNQKANLRTCDYSENNKNTRSRKDSTSIYLGVRLLKTGNQYASCLQVNGKNKLNLGVFKNQEEAAEAYNDAAKKHYGEFAKLNVINYPDNFIRHGRIMKNKTCSYKGVSYVKKDNQYRARIVYKRKEIHLGSFTSEIDAALAYNKKAIELLGNKAKLNIILN